MGAKILHIGSDWPFVAEAARQFEIVAPESNSLLVLLEPGASPRHFSEGDRSVEFMEMHSRSLPRLVKILRRADAVIVHGMVPLVAIGLAWLPRRTPLIWSGWGYDYYESVDGYFEKFLEPRTLSVAQAIRKSRSSYADTVYRKSRRALRKGALSLAARRSSYFSAPIPEDEDVFREAFPGYDGKYIQLNYGSLESMFGVSGNGAPGVGDAILLGNSATPSNNHLDAFPLVAPLVKRGMQLIVPLSYGDRAYAEAIISAGSDVFGDAFIPITNYMPLESYNRLMSRCHIVLMYHKRQQALGNIGTALYQGANVYLHEDSPSFHFLRRLGTSVRPASSLSVADTPLTRQSPSVIADDRSALGSFWGDGQVVENARCAALTLLGSA